MTNQERNIKLAEVLKYTFLPEQDARNEGCLVRRNRYQEWFKFNPCENWSQLMPLVVEHEISLVTRTDMSTWLGEQCGSLGDVNYKSIIKSDLDPRIALVDCLIAVLESKANGQ